MLFFFSLSPRYIQPKIKPHRLGQRLVVTHDVHRAVRAFPDFATIKIKYVPDEFCVELKSLKLYINGFRDRKVFHEDVTNEILDDLVKLLNPHEIEVVGDFTVRGNIHTLITSTHKK